MDADGRGIDSDIYLLGYRAGYRIYRAIPACSLQWQAQISCISRCNLVLSFGGRVANAKRRCKVMRMRSLNSEAHNGIQRLPGFLRKAV